MNYLRNIWKRKSYVFKYHRQSSRLAHSRAAASVEIKMATMQHKIFCVREFIKTGSATAVQRAFRLHLNIQPLTRKNICRWNHQFEQIGYLCKGKISGRPRVSEKNVRRIQESFESSSRKSTRRARRELEIPQPTVWCVLRRRLLFKPYRLQLVQAVWFYLFNHPVHSSTKCHLLTTCLYGRTFSDLCINQNTHAHSVEVKN